MEVNQQPAHGKAVASLVLGIIAIVFWFFGVSAFISLVLAIIGLVLASQAKKEGNDEGIRKAGFILSLIALIGGALIFVSCVLCVGCIGAADAAGALNSLDF